MNVKRAFKTVLMGTMVPLYRKVDSEFATTVDPRGVVTVSHGRTAKANFLAARREARAGQALAAMKDVSDGVFHRGWEVFNRATGFDRWIGMD